MHVCNIDDKAFCCRIRSVIKITCKHDVSITIKNYSTSAKQYTNILMSFAFMSCEWKKLFWVEIDKWFIKLRMW